MSITQNNQELLGILEVFLADLFDEEKSRLNLMGTDIIASEMLPKELKFERAVLDAFYLAEEKNVAPPPARRQNDRRNHLRITG